MLVCVFKVSQSNGSDGTESGCQELQRSVRVLVVGGNERRNNGRINNFSPTLSSHLSLPLIHSPSFP